MDLGATICTPQSPRLRHLSVELKLPRRGAAERRTPAAQAAQPTKPDAHGDVLLVERRMARCCCTAGRKRACSAA